MVTNKKLSENTPIKVRESNPDRAKMTYAEARADDLKYLEREDKVEKYRKQLDLEDRLPKGTILPKEEINEEVKEEENKKASKAIPFKKKGQYK